MQYVFLCVHILISNKENIIIRVILSLTIGIIARGPQNFIKCARFYRGVKRIYLVFFYVFARAYNFVASRPCERPISLH